MQNVAQHLFEEFQSFAFQCFELAQEHRQRVPAVLRDSLNLDNHAEKTSSRNLKRRISAGSDATSNQVHERTNIVMAAQGVTTKRTYNSTRGKQTLQLQHIWRGQSTKFAVTAQHSPAIVAVSQT